MCLYHKRKAQSSKQIDGSVRVIESNEKREKKNSYRSDEGLMWCVCEYVLGFVCKSRQNACNPLSETKILGVHD